MSTKFKFASYAKATLPAAYHQVKPIITQVSSTFDKYTDFHPGMSNLYVHLTASGNVSRRTTGPTAEVTFGWYNRRRQAFIDLNGFWFSTDPRYIYIRE